MAGFEKPSAIQQRAIMPILSGRDVIAQAQSGTGKTATIGMVTLETIDTLVREPQVCGVTVHIRCPRGFVFLVRESNECV